MIKPRTITEERLREKEVRQVVYAAYGRDHKALWVSLRLKDYVVRYIIVVDGDDVAEYSDSKEAVEHYNSLP